MGGGSSGGKNATPMLSMPSASMFNPFLQQPQPQQTPVAIPPAAAPPTARDLIYRGAPPKMYSPNSGVRTISDRDDLTKDIEGSFYGGGQATGTPTPTPTPTPKPWWSTLLGV